MSKLRVAASIIAISQLVLGVAFLFFPSFMYNLMGIQIPTQGVNYILGMLSARLLVYGVVLFIIQSDLPRHRLWLDGMMGIQLIDLAAGLYYTGVGAVAFADAAFPMVNAAIFLIALAVLRPSASPKAIGQARHA